MDITNASMTSLLKEALTPQPVPSAKAGPATAALVKALVQPPAPSFVPSAQVAAQALNGSLPRPAAEPSQRLSSAEVENAYRAVMEPGPGADGALTRSPAGRQAAEADQPSRTATQAQPAAGNTAGVSPTPSSSFSPANASAMLVAANANAPQARGAAVRPAGHAPRSQPGQTSLWTISIVTAIVSAATTTVVLLLLR
ncbi:hypothetical protein EN836_13390 [Mesorhizobium sp. M1C.F.Ca.ET.193.01.1.1]|uniref:hypothetical protein n=1 Tax=unclassified Mesorhizobium TaxID=325217 RepID=UPI000FD48F1A|nr:MULTISPECIES: hypothetical protein [unclassified Mesorhizobium]TGT00215.1 hypothetical protein EN820_32120 [bacterium M00.F.Ca.ET.177.01.1.1]TGQ53621.1 hypothetical protein EN853_13390 [Mesorhizobium sp. M1C.F.Ca.ET.210.01.1.1]TGQ71653.1 hypothetical protein EN855_013400 [Mesorhizobium sp. M1C.F.Ca.ET.212.01.1.1]TGR08394.1 hypothetical protein EN847_13395 [Mesorhizobium sp. M1C.F.Ca.ET.204.01.1.1]TGR28635.1 hypothetical protein EN839_13395 [Mesorhizobium sp. M1C.F.Ca.ET.196.01.1.1]